jgi:hypothetical protein
VQCNYLTSIKSHVPYSITHGGILVLLASSEAHRGAEAREYDCPTLEQWFPERSDGFSRNMERSGGTWSRTFLLKRSSFGLGASLLFAEGK